MGINNILNIATSGLNAAERGVNLVARNVANQGVEGYTAKRIDQTTFNAGNNGGGVRSGVARRFIDRFLQSQINQETSSVAYSETLLQSLQRLDQLFGQPGAENSLDGMLNRLNLSFQDLASQPQSYSARATAISSAQDFAGQLRYLSDQIQGMRQTAEDQLRLFTEDINTDLQTLHGLNLDISSAVTSGIGAADLLDQRDQLVEKIASYMDIDSRQDEQGNVVLFTKSGNSLLSGEPVTFEFDHHGNLNPGAHYSTDDAERRVGTLSIVTTDGFGIDLIEQGLISGGKMGAALELRDDILPLAQAQLDELAHALAMQLSTNNLEGAAASGLGGEAGFSLSAGDLKSGDTISLTIEDRATGVRRSVTLVAVSGAGNLPLDPAIAAQYGQETFGFNVDGSLADIAAELDGLFPNLDIAANGTELTFLDQGASGAEGLVALTSRQSLTDPASGHTAINLFTDGGADYTGAVSSGQQKQGFAARISVNPQILNNHALLVNYDAADPSLGGSARPLAMLERLFESDFQFSSTIGIGQPHSPFNDNIHAFTEAIISFQTSLSSRAEDELKTTEGVLSALKNRFAEETGVNVDQELARLIELQNAYAANARVIQVADELMQTLLGIG